MFLKEFNQTPGKKISKLNKLLTEQFGINLKSFPTRNRLEKLRENANMMVIQLRNSSKKFQLDPEYAKFLGIRDVADTMIGEGMYAESPKFQEMQSMITASVQELMDSGYTIDEACSECMNRYRMDNRFAYDDEFVLPIVLNAAKQYSESCSASTTIEDDVMNVQTELNERLMRELARECGVKLSNSESVGMIEKKLESFAKATGKSRESVVGFLNTLDETSMPNGIQMFGRKIAEMNRYNRARREAVQLGETEFEANGQTYNVFDGGEKKLEEGHKVPSNYAAIMAKKKKAEAKKKAKEKADKEKTTESASKDVSKMTTAKLEKMVKDSDGEQVSPVFGNQVKAAKKELAKRKKQKTNEGKDMGMFDDIINELLKEDVDVEQAEVVMAVRALADDIQSQIERIGRMINEDIPAISDQMRSEMGASTTQTFTDSITGILSAHLEATRGVKSNIDQTVSGMTGGEGLEDPGLGGPESGEGLPPAGVDDGSDPLDAEFPDDEMDVNDPAGAGPEDEPLGRAAV